MKKVMYDALYEYIGRADEEFGRQLEPRDAAVLLLLRRRELAHAALLRHLVDQHRVRLYERVGV